MTRITNGGAVYWSAKSEAYAAVRLRFLIFQLFGYLFGTTLSATIREKKYIVVWMAVRSNVSKANSIRHLVVTTTFPRNLKGSSGHPSRHHPSSESSIALPSLSSSSSSSVKPCSIPSQITSTTISSSLLTSSDERYEQSSRRSVCTSAFLSHLSIRQSNSMSTDVSIEPVPKKTAPSRWI